MNVSTKMPPNHLSAFVEIRWNFSTIQRQEIDGNSWKRDQKLKKHVQNWRETTKVWRIYERTDKQREATHEIK